MHTSLQCQSHTTPAKVVFGLYSAAMYTIKYIINELIITSDQSKVLDYY